MTETEKLLKEAAEVAKRTFVDPSEAAVLDIFRELCAERERMTCEADAHIAETLH